MDQTNPMDQIVEQVRGARRLLEEIKIDVKWLEANLLTAVELLKQAVPHYDDSEWQLRVSVFLTALEEESVTDEVSDQTDS